MNPLRNKTLFFLSMLSMACFIYSCTNSDTSYINYKLTEINYEDFNYCVLTNDKENYRIYDTIQENKNQRMQDTTKLYFPTLFTTFESSNNISFNFLEDGRIKFIDKSKRFQIIAQEIKKEDSIFVLKDNSIEKPIFVACEKNNKYRRTLSAFRVIYENEGLRKDSIGFINNKLIDLNFLRNEFKLNTTNNSTISDTLIWINLIYKYS